MSKKIKKALSAILIALCLNTTIAYGDIIKTIDDESVVTAAPPTIQGEAAIVVDVATGQVLYGKNIYDKHYPASITKIMTCTLALENLKFDDVITFSAEAVNVEYGSSAAYCVEGEQINVEDSIYGLMVHSCNDLANGLAEQVAGSLDSFANMMTERALALGCKNTNFKNAHGLDDEEHYTCAYDMAIIAKYAFDTQPMYREIIGTERYQIEPTNKCFETRYWKNGNKMILEESQYYYEYCIGGKTGYTELAGGTLVTYSSINDRVIMCVILGAPATRVAFEDSAFLYEYVRSYVPESYYESIDLKYKDDVQNYDNITNNDKEQIEASESEDVVANDTESDDTQVIKTEDNEEGMPLWLKIIIFIVSLLVILYVYLRIRLYFRRKKRRELRRLRAKRMREDPEYYARVMERRMNRMANDRTKRNTPNGRVNKGRRYSDYRD